MELKLYSREWCSWCIDAKDYLSEKGYRFQEIDVGKDRRAYEDMKKLSAQTYVPTFVAGGKNLAKFDCRKREKILKRDHNKSEQFYCFFVVFVPLPWCALCGGE